MTDPERQFKAGLIVTIKEEPGLRDDIATTTMRGLAEIDEPDVIVSTGKYLEITGVWDNEEHAAERVNEMAAKLLASPVTENSRIDSITPIDLPSAE